MSKIDTPYLNELEDRLYTKAEVEAREKGLAANKLEILGELKYTKEKLRRSKEELREALATIARFSALAEAL